MGQILKGKDAKEAATEWLKAHPDVAMPGSPASPASTVAMRRRR